LYFYALLHAAAAAAAVYLQIFFFLPRHGIMHFANLMIRGSGFRFRFGFGFGLGVIKGMVEGKG